MLSVDISKIFKPENPLHGRDSIESALVDGANTKIMLDGFMAAAEAFRNSTPGMKNRAMPGPHNYAQIPELAQRGLLRLDNFLSDLEIHFESNEYMVNDFFSWWILVLSFVSILQSG